MSSHSERLSPPHVSPSQTLLTAALSGLLSVSLGACGDDSQGGETEHEHEHDNENDASTSADAAAGDAGVDAAVVGPEITNEIPGVQSFETLKARCDQEGGYIQLHAACAGVNACKGFFYGDWGPEDSVLQEHTCAAINGCAGLSCVYLPPDSGKTGQQVYENTDIAPTGPQACINCHAVWSGHDAPPDMTKFKVWVMPGSTRTEQNWLDGVTAEQQEGIVAFGAVKPYIDGLPSVGMAAYHKLYSRAEVQRVVEYIRTQLTPLREEIGKPQ